ncbi:MAG: cytochrome b/b6 domain-containing protein [ANME-2 cluster archaeon]|nr:cytochrome b/b6 domain-containing protein [ANME-2 cluster archaeon]
MRSRNRISKISLFLTILILFGILQYINFQSSPEKVIPEGAGETVWINTIIKIIVAMGVIGLFLITIAIHRKFTKREGFHDLPDYQVTKYSQIQHISEPTDVERLIERFSPLQITVHAVTGLSILTLYVTGIPLLYPEHLGWITDLIELSKNMFLHRLAGLGLLSAAIYYLIYSLLQITYVNKDFTKNIIPTLNDIKGAISDVLIILGKTATKYQSNKFNWLEKVDIWSVALFDGLIMCVTGIIIWAPWLFSSFIPNSYILSINVLHGGFAILSLCGILLHFYVVHLTPHRFPMDFSMFTGTVPLQEAEEEYPLWVKDISGDKS